MKSLFLKLFGQRTKTQRSCCQKKCCAISHKRHLNIEPLESRDLLAISPADFSAIRAAYPDLNLSANINNYNLIEITASELSEGKLQTAIDTAKGTTKDDLIVLRTSATQNRITLSGSEMKINANASQYGTVNIVSFGDSPLTINANGKSRHFLINNQSNVVFAGITFTGGFVSQANGGSIISQSSTLRLVHTTFTNNVSEGTHWWISGGAVRTEGSGSTLWVSDSLFQNNTSLFGGGGLSVGDTTTTVKSTRFLENQCSSYGGGLYANGGTLSIEGTVFDSNTSLSEGNGHAGGLFSEHNTININETTFKNNKSQWGAGFRVYDTTFTGSNLIVHDNYALYDGGGANFNSSQVTLSNASFWNNYSGLYGGAIFCENATGTFSNITAGSNTSGTDGGGFFTRAASNITLINSTLSANTALWGGGLYVQGDSAVVLYNNIIAGNTNKNVSSDIFQYDTTKNLSGSNNIIGIGKDLKGLTDGVNSNRIGTETAPVDAMVGPVTDLGIGVPVMPLLSLSPAIDAAASRTGVPALDAAGRARFDNPATTNRGTGTPNYIDIGSYEYQGQTDTGTVVADFEQPFVPKGITSDSKDRLIATDSLNNRIIVYSSAGVELFTFGFWGEEDGQLYRPGDVAVDKNDNIYVLDTGNHRVQVFDSTGKFLRSFGGYGTAAGQFSNPQGIGYDAATNRIYVADTGNHRVQCFTVNGQLVTTFGNDGVIGTTGTLKRDHTGFDCPTDVAVHPINGNIYIADRVNSRIEVYDTNGKYVRSFLAVYQPEAISFDSRGNLFIAGDDYMKGGGYVNSAFEGRIRVLQNGSELVSTTFYGGIDDLGRKTSGVAVLSDGSVLVSDEFNNRLAKTQIVDTGLPFPDGLEFVDTITDIEIDTSGTEVIVRWKTAKPSPSSLRWGTDKNNISESLGSAQLKTSHEVKITGLLPQTLLYYQIGYNDSFMANTTRWTEPDKINSGAPSGEKLVLRLKAVGIVYTDVNDQVGITQGSEERIQKIEQLYRDTAVFIWQNTGFSVWIDFVDMPRYTGDFVRDGEMENAETILTNLGYSREDDINLVLDTSNCWDGAGGGVGGSGYMFGRGIGWSYQEWDNGRTIMHEINHIFDFAVYGWSDLGKYEQVHCIWSIKDTVGGDCATNAQIYANLYDANYTATGGDFSKWITVSDTDNDGLPDDSPTDQGLVNPLPITEKTLGSSPTKKDTDDDGISDYDEARYLVYGGINPVQSDTDGDGLPDGADLNPAYPIGDQVRVGTPILDGVINRDENWTIVVDHWSYDNTYGVWDNNAHADDVLVAMSWDDDYLYIGVEYSGWDWVSFKLDGGYDNWYLGPATYEIGLPSWSSEPEVGVIASWQDMQMMVAAEYGDFFWDNDSKFINAYQGRPIDSNAGDGLGFGERLINHDEILFVKRYDGDKDLYIWEVAIPWSSDVTGLVGYDKKILGIDVTVVGDKLFNTDSYAKIMLVDQNKTTLNLKADKNTIEEGVQDGITFTVTRIGDVSKALELAVTSSHPTELAVPQSVVIPAGQSSATFKASGVLDGKRDGNKNVTVTVGTKSNFSNAVIITVLDIDRNVELDVPTGFAVKEKTSNSVTLQWNDHPDATQYELQYRQKGVLSWSTGPSGAFSEVSNLFNATVASLKSSTDYEFRLRAKDAFGESDWTNILTAKTDQELTPPAVPSGFGVKEKTSNSVTLQWNNDADVTQYELQYRRKGVLTWTAVPSGTLASNRWTAIVSDLAPSTEYEFRLRAKNAVGESDWTNILAALTDNESFPPTVPSGFGVKEKTSNSVTLQWNNDADVTQYELQYRRKGILTWTAAPSGILASNQWTATVFDLAPSTEYEFRLRAKNAVGESDWTNTLTALTDSESVPPQVPAGFGVNEKTVNSVTLQWINGVDANEYELQYRRKGVLPWSAGPAGTFYETSGWYLATVSLLASSTEYEFRLRAKNDYGSSDWTNILTATTEAAASRPQAVITCGQDRVQAGCSLFLSGAESYDATNGPLEYLWDTDGDGIYETTQKAFWFSAENILPGRRHTVSLIVKNGDGIVSEPSAFTFYVDSVTPTFYIKAPSAEDLATGNHTYWEFFAESSKFSSIVHWSIDWGDDSMKTEIPGGPRNEVRVSHRFSTAGESNITISTTDINGDVSSVVIGSYIVSQSVQTQSSAIPASRIVETENEDLLNEVSIQQNNSEITPCCQNGCVEPVLLLEEFLSTNNISDADIQSPRLSLDTKTVESMLQRHLLDLDQREKSSGEIASVMDYVLGEEESFENSWLFSDEESSDEADFWCEIFDENDLLDSLK